MGRLVASERLEAGAAMKIEVDVIKPATPSEGDLRRRKLTYFAAANVLAVLFCIGFFWLFIAIPEGTRVDGVMGAVWRFLRRHETIAALAASLPFFSSLLVGQFEMRKARARRTRKEAEEKRARIEAARVEQEAARAARHARS
jgi:hypothetical protein